MNRFIFFTNGNALKTYFRTIGLISLPILGDHEGNFKALDFQDRSLAFTQKDVVMLLNDDLNVKNVSWIERFINLPDTTAMYIIFHEARFDRERQYRPLQSICGDTVKIPLYHVIHHHSVPNHFYQSGLSEYVNAPTREVRMKILDKLADEFPKSIPAVELFKHLSIIKRKLVTGQNIDLLRELPLLDLTGLNYWDFLPVRADGSSWEIYFNSVKFENAFKEFELFLASQY